MVQKTAAVSILYNPEKFVEQNINSYVNHVGKLYLIDNSETAVFDYQSLLTYSDKIILIHDGKNEGIAKRLNDACALALKDGFEFLLTMDQDSYFEENHISTYLSCLNSFADKSHVSLFGINYETQSETKNCIYERVKNLITSGSIINLSNYKNIGAFDENLFIDFVDIEYCFKSIISGYKIIKFSNVYMHHAIGAVIKKRSLKNLSTSIRSIHSAARLYYMQRNFLYLKKKYKNYFSEELAEYKKDILNRIKNKLLYHPHRFQTIKLLIKARRDFKNNKMGKQL
jgi:rhamnosyltransferase